MQQEQLQHALAFASVGAWELQTRTGVFTCNEQFKTLLGLPGVATITERRLFEELIDEEHRERVRSGGSTPRAIPIRPWKSISRDLAEPAATLDSAARHASARQRNHRVQRAGERAARGGVDHRARARYFDAQGVRANIRPPRRAAPRASSEEATRAMDHFVAAVSHELRSPLGAIQSWATLLQRSADVVATARARGTVIERNARQLALMVDDLLDSGAIATGKLSIELAPVDLGALAGNIAEDMRMRIEEKGAPRRRRPRFCVDGR
jgi:signal transduction histidine kinase